MKTFRRSMLVLGAAVTAGGLAGAQLPAYAAPANPCAAMQKSCAAKPARSQMRSGPCGAKTQGTMANSNPCAAKPNPCAAKANPCVVKRHSSKAHH